MNLEEFKKKCNEMIDARLEMNTLRDTYRTGPGMNKVPVEVSMRCKELYNFIIETDQELMEDLKTRQDMLKCILIEIKAL